MTTVLARFRSARTRHGALLAVLAAGLLATTAAPAPATAQEGHPLKGSWLGTWKDNAALGDDLILILEWDGKAITGMINPGTDNIPVGKATLDPNGWKVTIEADAKDKSGAALHYVVEATIENLELPNRSLVGTWRSQRGRGAFEASRQ
jgi:mRNA-degrading endonuclease YafQ of YafQ-DinJ toxin-antitoxin module